MKGKESTNYLQTNYFRTIVYLLIIGIALFAFRDQIFDATNEEPALLWKENTALVAENEINWSYVKTNLNTGRNYIFTKESRVPANEGSLRINIELPSFSSVLEESVFSKVVFYDAGGDDLGTVEHTFLNSSLTIDLEERGFEDARTVKFNLFHNNPIGVFGLDEEGYENFKSSTTFEYLVFE